MGHCSLLSKLANLSRKTCIKIGWADTRQAPRGREPAGCHFGSAVSIVAAQRSGKGDEGSGTWREREEDNQRSRGAFFQSEGDWEEEKDKGK